MALLWLIKAVIVRHVGSRGNDAKALPLNNIFRWSYPLPFLALLGFVLMRESIVPEKKTFFSSRY